MMVNEVFGEILRCLPIGFSNNTYLLKIFKYNNIWSERTCRENLLFNCYNKKN